MASTLMATPKTLKLTLHDPLTALHHGRTAVSLPSSHLRRLAFFSRHKSSTSPLHKFPKLKISFLKKKKMKISAPISQTLQIDRYSSIKPAKAMDSDRELLSESTRTVATLLAVVATASKFFADEIFCMAVQLRGTALSVAGPAFFAAMKTRGMNTPFTVVAAGMAKWLDIYSGVLTVRIMLSWFPNIPWDKQPLSAIRDLCDPYLNLFRNIIPPVFGQLDVSPLLAFAVLGTMASILNSSRQPI